MSTSGNGKDHSALGDASDGAKFQAFKSGLRAAAGSGGPPDVDAFARASSKIIRDGQRFVPDPDWPSFLELAIEAWGEPTARKGDEVRFGKKESKSAKVSECVWSDFESGEGGGYFELYKIARPGQELPTRRVKPQWLPRDQDIKVTYNYTDADGNLLLQVVRTRSGKPRFRQRRPDGKGGWLWNVDGVVKPLYRLPELRAAPPDLPVWVCEGEKDADRLAKLGLVATTNVNGGAFWSVDYSAELAGRHVILLEDNDLAGRKRCAKLAMELKTHAASLRLLTFEDLPEKGDVSDWLNLGHGSADLEKRAQEARAPDETGKVEPTRKAPRPGRGKPLLIAPPEPWPDPVDGVDLACDLADFFTKYALLPEGAADAMSLWALHTYCFDLWEYTPRLRVRAAYKRAGKTRTLELLKLTVCKPAQADSITSASMFRVVSEFSPTLLLDEADETVAGNPELQAMLNSGFQRGGGAIRVNPNTFELDRFDTFAPCAIAGIGKLKGTLEDRSIEIEMRRALRRERRPKLDADAKAEGLRLARQCARWVADNRAALQAAKPDVRHLDDRTDDKWTCLYAVAEVLGDYWPLKVREASNKLTLADMDTAGVVEQLLTDIEEVFTAAAADTAYRLTEMPSTDLADRLKAMPGRLWAEDVPQEHGPAKALTTNKLARLLWTVRIRPRLFGDKRLSGYRLTDFADAFERNRTFDQQREGA
jgi:hypothetical protein